jgi:hypothetical protein
MNLSPPTAADVQLLAAQLARAAELVARARPGSRLNGTEADLELLQAVLDGGHVSPDQGYDLQCLGVAFGTVLIAAFPGLDWAIIEDEHGRDPTVRYRDESLVLNVLTMISKRVEDGERVNVRDLLAQVVGELPSVMREMGIAPLDGPRVKKPWAKLR